MPRGNYASNNGHVMAFRQADVYNLYVNQQLASTDIAARYGVTKPTVLRRLRTLGISRRSQRESKSTAIYLKKVSSTNHPLYNPVGGYVTAKRRGYGNKFGCVICGWKETTTDIHHKIPRRDGGKDTMENLTILCPNHHRLAHRGKIDTRDLPSIQALIIGTQS